MINRRLFLFAVLATLSSLGSGADVAEAADRPIVLELFTSQGCSSCPPADALLTELAAENDVIALSFHVDYWDYIGWKDEMALPASSERQRAYAQRMNLRYVYTPQLVVDGVEQAVGSKAAAVRHCMAESLLRPKAQLSLEGENRISVAFPEGFDLPEEPLDALLISYQPWTVARIGKGENRGQTLGYTNSVRAVEKIGRVTADGQQLTLPSLSAPGAVLLLQEAGFGAIRGALKLR